MIFTKFYRRLKLYASANWPFLWASRLDLPILFFIINVVFIFAALDLSRLAVNILAFAGFGRISTSGVYWISVAISGVFIGISSVIGMIYWITVIWRSLPMKEIPRLANSPGIFTLMVGFLFPFLAGFILVSRVFWFDILFLDLGSTDAPNMNNSDITSLVAIFSIAANLSLLVKISRLTSIGSCFLGFLILLALIALSFGSVFAVDYTYKIIENMFQNQPDAFVYSSTDVKVLSIAVGFIFFYLPMFLLIRTFFVGRRTKIYTRCLALILWIGPFVGFGIVLIFALVLDLFEIKFASLAEKIAWPWDQPTFVSTSLLVMAVVTFGSLCRVVAELNILPQE